MWVTCSAEQTAEEDVLDGGGCGCRDVVRHAERAYLAAVGFQWFPVNAQLHRLGPESDELVELRNGGAHTAGVDSRRVSPRGQMLLLRAQCGEADGH